MKITFEGEFADIANEIAEFFLKQNEIQGILELAVAEAPASEAPAEDKPKRKRRSKAEIEADKAAAEAAPIEGNRPNPDPLPRRRRTAGVAEETSPEPEGEATEISDEDVMKAASQAAQEATPKAVMDVLAEFAVVNVADLGQGQRREFIDKLDGLTASNELDDEIPF